MSYGMDGWCKEIPGGDLISRAEAIDALGEKPLAWMENEYEQGLQNQWVWDVNALKALPSAQPERKTGEWREHIFDGIMGRRPRALMCTHCNVISMYASNFCPNCGADMREVDDD